jgi:hypothetical protein
MQFLQMKKLLFELEVFQKEKNLSGFEFPGEARLLAELKESATAVEKSKEKIPYLSRLAYGRFLLLSTRSSAFRHRPSSRGDGLGYGQVSCGDLVFSVGCGLLASLIPLGTLCTSFLYGLTMPLAVALIFSIVTR